jgi:hypothetical protein
LKPSRFNGRMLLLLLAEAMLLFGGLIVAVYVRLGAVDAEETLLQRHGFYKAALATVFCLASFYLSTSTISSSCTIGASWCYG